MSLPPGDCGLNYFNYFTEVEEHFQRVRGTALFLLSSLDWALLESWKNAGVPLEAVLRGIDAAFEKARSRKSRIEKVNSLAYCTQAVMLEAQAMAGASPQPSPRTVAAPFSLDELKDFLSMNVLDLRARGQAAYGEIAAAVEKLYTEAERHYLDLEQLEQRLTALEEKMIAIARAAAPEEALFEARRAMDVQLKPYRSKMSAGQLAMLERQYLDRTTLEREGLPRLSLFYLR